MTNKILITLVLNFIFHAESTLAEEIKVAVGLALPPYVLSKSHTGMEMDIVKESLAQKGHILKPIYVPFMRVATSFENGRVDAALTVNESSGIKSVHYSDSHITYQNVAIGLSKTNLKVDNVSSMKNYSVIAFQNATKYLGPEFAKMAKVNKRYSEKAKQDKQLAMLYSKRADLIVLDINIYKYYKKLEKRVSTEAKVDIFEVFQPTSYKVGFRNKQVRDDFNTGLKALKESGRYQEIIDSYTK